jgi:hypothetical protein
VIRVKSEALQPGMVVARDVKNIDGMLLVPSGCELSERQVNILQAWGVVEVEVEAGEEMAKAHDPLAQLPPETLARITAELRGRFWRPDEFGPVPAEIFKLMLLRQAQRMLRASAPS